MDVIGRNMYMFFWCKDLEYPILFKVTQRLQNPSQSSFLSDVFRYS